MAETHKYLQYLQALKYPFKKLTKLEFLQPDGSVAFFLSNNSKRGYNQKYQSSAFIQGGTLNVSLQNGQRRKATITLSNLDNAFDYNVNNIWFGTQLRLSMGLVLPDGTDFYLPQMVGVIKNPQSVFSENQKTITFPIVDKWANLDGSLGGTLPKPVSIPVTTEEEAGQNALYKWIYGLLHLSKFDLNQTDDITKAIDPTPPILPTYYLGQTWDSTKSDGSVRTIYVTDIPFPYTENCGGNIGSLLSQLNEQIIGLIGYDAAGALKIEPSQSDIDDYQKAVLWNFTPKNCTLSQISETLKNDAVYNDIVIVGGGNSQVGVWGRASNYDPASDTNINLIGIKTQCETRANFFNAKQCTDFAQYRLKQKTVLQKSVNISCSQMFHLTENQLVTVQRTDKPGSPTERHLINSFSLPLSETGAMTINATSVADIPKFTLNAYIEGGA